LPQLQVLWKAKENETQLLYGGTFDDPIYVYTKR